MTTPAFDIRHVRLDQSDAFPEPRLAEAGELPIRAKDSAPIFAEDGCR